MEGVGVGSGCRARQVSSLQPRYPSDLPTLPAPNSRRDAQSQGPHTAEALNQGQDAPLRSEMQPALQMQRASSNRWPPAPPSSIPPAQSNGRGSLGLAPPPPRPPRLPGLQAGPRGERAALTFPERCAMVRRPPARGPDIAGGALLAQRRRDKRFAGPARSCCRRAKPGGAAPPVGPSPPLPGGLPGAYGSHRAREPSQSPGLLSPWPQALCCPRRVRTRQGGGPSSPACALGLGVSRLPRPAAALPRAELSPTSCNSLFSPGTQAHSASEFSLCDGWSPAPEGKEDTPGRLLAPSPRLLAGVQGHACLLAAFVEVGDPHPQGGQTKSKVGVWREYFIARAL